MNIPSNNKESEEMTVSTATNDENTQERNIEKELNQFNSELHQINRKFQELHGFMAKQTDKLKANKRFYLDTQTSYVR